MEQRSDKLQDEARPGDILLCGVGGKLTMRRSTPEKENFALMATEKTQRGFFEPLVVDLFSWPVVQILKWVGGAPIWMAPSKNRPPNFSIAFTEIAMPFCVRPPTKSKRPR